VAARRGVPVSVRDVADLQESSEERTNAVTANGQRAVLFNILKQPGASTVAVSQEIERSLAGMASAMPHDIVIRPFYDESHLLQESIGSVRDSILIGAALAVVVLILSLGSWRTSAIVLLTVPVTVLVTLLLLRALGQTLNLMTLGGLAVGPGLIIDDVVVTVGNIDRHVREGSPPHLAAVGGIAEIAKPVIGSSLTRICVFLPLLAAGGITGAFFAPLALTLTTMLTVSIALALVVAPALCGWLMPSEAAGATHAERTSRFVARLRNAYGRTLRAVLRRRWLALGTSLALGVLAVVLLRGLPTGFMPVMDEGAFILDYFLPDGTSLAETDRQCRIVEDILQQQPDVAGYSRRTGLELGFFATEQNTGDFAVDLKPRGRRQRSVFQLIAALREECARQVPQMRVEFIQIVQDRVNDLAGTPNPIEVKIFGDDPQRLQGLAREVGKIVGGTRGIVEEFDGIVSSGPELSVRIDPSRAARAGLAPRQVIDALTIAMFGEAETVIRRGERMIGIRVTYPPALRRSEEDVRALQLVTPSGQLVPLGNVATITEGPGSTQKDRENQKPVVKVTAALEGVDLGTAIRQIRSAIAAQVRLPEGYSIEYGGLYATQQQSFRRLLAVFILGMGLVLVVTIAQYEAFAEPVALFVSAAFSLVGVVLALYLTNTPFNASSFTGAIMVFGMVLTNGIVLMDYIRARIARGMTFALAAVDAGRTRVRPVLMTSVIAILALLPLALGIGAGAEMQKPLAIAVIGGLATSPFFALLLGPVLLGLLRREK